MYEITTYPLPKQVRLFAKLEFLNPGGSIKDRLGFFLLKKAIKSGRVTKGSTVIEATAGNTGIGLALAAIHYQLKVVFITPEKFSKEKQILMKALGAKVVNTPTEDGMKGAIEKANSLAQQIPDAYVANQFNTDLNPQTYYELMGPEIYRDLDGKVDIFIAGAGTGGTFMGVSQYLKEKNSQIQTIIVEPEGSILNGGKPKAYRTEGIGMEFLPPYMDRALFDHIYTIGDDEAFKRVAEISRKEGLLVGSSSGAVLEAALREANQASPGTNIVTIFPDSSERYMSTSIYME